MDRPYRLPYQDPGQRRPWVPYQQWLRERAAERLRVPGVFRNDRARRGRERRQGVRMPPYERIVPAPHRDREVRDIYNANARVVRGIRRAGGVANVDREAIREAVEARNERHHELHVDADFYQRWHPDDAEERWDERHGAYGGRYEEFLPEKREAEDEPDVEDLPVIGGKRVKFEDEND